MFNYKSMVKELDCGMRNLEDDVYTLNIEKRFWKRLRDLGWFFLIWLAGEFVLLMAATGSPQISLLYPYALWKYFVFLILILAIVTWGVLVPLWYAFTSILILAGLVVAILEEFALAFAPLKFTNKPVFEHGEKEIFERYL